MKIKLNSLYLTSFDSNDKRKLRFIKNVCEDPLVRNFVSFNMKENFELANLYDNDDLNIGPAYIVGDEKKLVGFIRMARISDSGLVDLHYGVNPEYRNQGYGSRILLEVGDYILKNVKEAKKIKLDIREINSRIVMCAEKANYKHEYSVDLGGDYCKVMVYTKTRKNKR